MSEAGMRDKTIPTEPRGQITPQEVRTQLRRINVSSPIAKAPRLQAFLEYVVEESLAGRASRIKAFSVGQAVFGGDENFDPQTNTIVRVEAGRLRRRISQYYLGDGQDDPVLIDIPKGTYAPDFRRRRATAAEPAAQVPEARTASLPTPGLRSATLVASGALIATLGFAGWWFLDPGGAENSPAIEQLVDPLAKPFVAVLPLDSLSGDPIENRISVGISEAIIAELSKLSGLSVMAHTSMLELDNRSTTVNSFRQKYGVTHVLRGGLEREGDTVRIHAQLVDTATTATIWADHMDGGVNGALEFQDFVASQIVAALSIRLDPNEQARFLHRYSTDREALLLFRQALTLMMAPTELTRITTARRLFQRISEIDPNFAGGLAGESLTFSLQVIFLKSAEPKKDLELAVTQAQKAIEIDADYGMGYASLGFASALSGRLEQGTLHARRAIAVQPGDAYSRWMFGVVLVLSGDTERAVAQLTEALRLDPAEPRTPYLNVLGIAHFVAGDYSAAIDVLERNLERGGPTGPHMDLFRAGAYADLGQDDDARAVVDAMLLSYPEFPAESWLSTWLDPDSLNKTMNDLYRMGLPRD